MKKNDAVAAIAEGRNKLLARLTAELKHADDDASADQFIEAERIVDQYLDGVSNGSTALPDAQDLAFACMLMLVMTQTTERSDLDVLGRLNTPSVGIALFSMADQVRSIKRRAVEKLEAWAAEDAKPSPTSASDSDVPF